MKRLVLLLVVFALAAVPLSAQKRELGKVKTLVIDPGHGGAKPGARGSQIWEKDLVLGVALQFGKLVEKNLPDVKVIYTRTTDVDITLAERANIANKAKADLFISVHANSHPTDKPTGVETFVMGLSKSKANLEVAKKENADILLESDYQSNSAYQGFDPNAPESYVMFAMYQNAYLSKSLDFANYIQKQYSANLTTSNRGVKQAELFVIYKTAMPAVLTEIGFISNPAEEAFMMSKAGTMRIATCLYNAFAIYKAHEEGTEPKLIGEDAAAAAVAESKPAKPVAAAHATEEAKEPADKVEADKERPAVVAVTESKEQPAEKVEPAAEEGAQPVAAQPAEVQQPVVVQQEATHEQPEAAAKPEEPSQRVEAQPEAAPVAEEETAAAEEGPRVSFRVQFLRTDQMLKAGDKQLKGLDNFTYYKSGNFYCYMWGDTRSMQAAKVMQRDVRAKGFKDAFVVAFADGERISLQKAVQMLNQ